MNPTPSNQRSELRKKLHKHWAFCADESCSAMCKSTFRKGMKLIESHVAQQVKEARIDAVRKFTEYSKVKNKLFLKELEDELKRLQSPNPQESKEIGE